MKLRDEWIIDCFIVHIIIIIIIILLIFSSPYACPSTSVDVMEHRQTYLLPLESEFNSSLPEIRSSYSE